MIDLKRESAITLAEVPSHIPKRNGRKVHYSTVYRWVTKGAKGRRLESLLVGGIRYTTVEALGRFLKAHTAEKAIPEDVDETSALIENALNEAGV